MRSLAASKMLQKPDSRTRGSSEDQGVRPTTDGAVSKSEYDLNNVF